MIDYNQLNRILKASDPRQPRPVNIDVNRAERLVHDLAGFCWELVMAIDRLQSDAAALKKQLTARRKSKGPQK